MDRSHGVWRVLPASLAPHKISPERNRIVHLISRAGKPLRCIRIVSGWFAVAFIAAACTPSAGGATPSPAPLSTPQSAPANPSLVPPSTPQPSTDITATVRALAAAAETQRQEAAQAESRAAYCRQARENYDRSVNFNNMTSDKKLRDFYNLQAKNQLDMACN